MALGLLAGNYRIAVALTRRGVYAAGKQNYYQKQILKVCEILKRLNWL